MEVARSTPPLHFPSSIMVGFEPTNAARNVEYRRLLLGCYSICNRTLRLSLDILKWSLLLLSFGVFIFIFLKILGGRVQFRIKPSWWTECKVQNFDDKLMFIVTSLLQYYLFGYFFLNFYVTRVQFLDNQSVFGLNGIQSTKIWPKASKSYYKWRLKS